ncbi:MAG TPA: phenylalanine--tRNA ligase subunit alpha, partial [Candidatus Dojkabacteria bacterium]
EPVEGSHGKKAYLAYKGSAKKIDKSDIQKRVNQIIEKNLKITVKLVSLEELKKEALYVFDNLPKDKPLRVVTLEGYKSVPDGGTLVKSTGEIESIIIESIEDIKDDEFRVNYSTKITKPKSFTAPKITTDDSQKITEKIKKLKDSASKEVGEISTLQMIEKAKIKYLGRKSELVQILRMLKDLPYDIRGEIGKQSNDLKEFLTSLIEKKEEKLKSDKFNETLKEEWLDVTVPVNTEGIGHVHPLTQMLWRVTDIFQSMGFEVIEPTEIDNDFNHFTALNIPENHPARDMWDTFWTKDGRIATAHTSTMQNRILSRIKPPIRAIIPGRCFRNEATDSSHEHTFYQVEGIYLDKNINLTHLVSTIRTFLEAFFEREVRLKIQPTYFPFVEPALEVMMERPGFKKNDNKYNKSEWLELMPCGPIHPNVLKLAGIDPDEYSGFAWGLGLDRLVMVKYGIEDIRHFHGGDLRFLSQF